MGRVQANNNVADMPAELAEYRTMVEDLQGAPRDEWDEAIGKFNNKYGSYHAEFWGHIVNAEVQIKNMVVNLSDNGSTKGYIRVDKGNSIGRYVSNDTSIFSSLKEMYPRLTFDENAQFKDGDYIICHGIGDGCKNWTVVDIKNNAFCMYDSSKPVQLVPHDSYVGPFTTAKSAGFRHQDGTVEHMKANDPEIVKNYLELLSQTPDISILGKQRAETVATYFSTKEELEAVVDTLEVIQNSLKDHPEAKQQHGITSHIIRQLRLNETDYMGIAKLIRTDDKYDDMKLLNYPIIYNDDYSSRIEDNDEIKRIQDKFGKTREMYYGENSMMKTLEIQLGMALNAEDAKKGHEDAINVIDSADDYPLADELGDI